MSPSQVRTRSNGGERFCRLSTTSPSLAASTCQSELSRCALIDRSEPDASSLHPTQQFFKKNSPPSRRRYWGSSTDILTKTHEEDDSHSGSGRKSRRGHRLRRPQA